ncbi:MAG: hypothetical protein AAF585_25545, partial [Verrucomicrobiota bacterium]
KTLEILGEDRSEMLDTWSLHDALFASREENWGEARDHLARALEIIGGEFPTNTADDWYRASAVLLHQGYGPKVVALLEEGGWHVSMMPWYEAIRAHVAETRRHLLDIPQEAREVAGKIYDEIAMRMQWLPDSTRNLAIS